MTLTENELLQLEERLRQAMLTSNVADLNELIADDLIFTGADGATLDKTADLAAHQSGKLKLTTLNPSERQTRISAHVAIVSVKMQLGGDYDGHPFQGSFRYTRVWGFRGKWQVLTAHASAM